MKSISTSKIIELLLIISAIALPLFLNVAIISWILIAVIRLSSAAERNAMATNFKQHKLLWMLPLLYLLYLIGLLWTSNFKYAGLDLQIKLTFLLLPFIIGTLNFSPQQIKKVLYGFVGGTFIASVYLLMMSYSVYTETNDPLSFFYASLTSPLMHPTYFGMYVNFALLILLAQLGKSKFDLHYLGIKFGLLFFSLMALLIEARTAQAATLITVVGMILFHLFKRNYSAPSILLLLFIIFFSLGAQRYLSHISNRYALVVSAMETKTQTDQQKQYDSTTGRIEIWKLAGELIQKNILLGTGTGDVRDELVKTYYAHDFEYGYAKKLNAHNQFLQIWATVGVVGILLFVLALLLPFLTLKFYPQFLFPMFLLIIALNAMTESTMEVQRGVLFFAFFYSLLAVGSEIHSTQEPQQKA
jgi:O-antigen ligase